MKNKVGKKQRIKKCCSCKPKRKIKKTRRPKCQPQLAKLVKEYLKKKKRGAK